VIEVGLGGRFDSTNVCNPLVSVITNVGFDHMAQLGETLEEIAYQKAGIIKRRVPVVSGVTQPGPREVVRKVAAEAGSPLWEIDREVDYDYGWREPTGGRTPSRVEPLWVRAVTPHGVFAPAPLKLLGEHQAVNAVLAIATAHQLRDAGLGIPDSSIARGLATVSWPARVEVLSERPTVVLDCAHNVPSSESLVWTLSQSISTSGRKAVVFAVSADKQYGEMLRLLAGYFDHFHLTTYGNPRCVPPSKLAEVLAEVAPGKAFTTHATGRDAWAAAHAVAGENDLVCVTGSMFLAGELRPVVCAGERPGLPRSE
jgi:dihydrofolate synthase/folylpolyglutamate synthase